MRVDKEDDRLEMPEECDHCGSMVKLTRYSHYGPGYNIDWLCPYCACDFTRGDSDVVNSIAVMLNTLEQRIN